MDAEKNKFREVSSEIEDIDFICLSEIKISLQDSLIVVGG